MSEQTITLEIRKLFVDDMTIEIPNAPEIFNEELNPEITLGVQHDIKELKEEHYYGVRLRLTVTAKDQNSDKTIYLVEVRQGGVFEISGLEPAQLHHALNVYCTTTLFPYARETVSNAINRAGFPPLYLQPINFDAIYQNQLEQAAAQQESENQANENNEAQSGNA